MPGEDTEDEEVALTRMLDLLRHTPVRVITISYSSFSFQVTYDLLKLTRFAYNNPNPTNPTLYMSKYIVACLTAWTLVESDGVTQLPITFASLARMGTILVAQIGKGLSNDYATVVSAVRSNYSLSLLEHYL